MATPLYRYLKEKGSTFYAFPGAAEDISSSFQNDNYKIKFSKFVLLNMKIEDYKYLEQEDGPFVTDSVNQINLNNGDALINSLRNYVANHEEVIRGSLINNTDLFYDPLEMQTTSEKIFWKWLREVGGVEFEPAIPNDEYIDGAELQVDPNLPDDYFKEYIWKERDTIPYRILTVDRITGETEDEYKITTTTSTTLKPGDKIKMTNRGSLNIDSGLAPGESRIFEVAYVEDSSLPQNQSRNNEITIFISTGIPGLQEWNNAFIADIELIYDKTIQYIGEIQAVNNTLLENKAYSEVWAYVPNQNGKTPDILFRIESGVNYSPGLQFPILPSQDQPEIVGAESFLSPIVSHPEDYPGDQYAQFSLDQKYTTSQGFQDRKRGPYYGIPTSTDRTQERVAQAPYVWPEFDAEKLDGVTMDFDTNHYSKMAIPGKESQNFDEFDATSFNNLPPEDFEFNAVLWYYQVEDQSQLKTDIEQNTNVEEETSETGQSTTVTVVTTEETFDETKVRSSVNLYGVTFLNGLDQEEFIEERQGIPTYKKLVTTDQQDGLSYSFSLNLNFNILTENLIETFDPSKVYSLFSFDLYQEIMRRLAETTQLYVKLIQQNAELYQDVLDLKTLIYSQTDIQRLEFQMQTLYQLLDAYSSLQIVSTDTIKVERDPTTSPPNIKLHSTDSQWGVINQYPVSSLYNEETNTATPVSVIVPINKDFMVIVINNDQADIELNGDLNIVLDRDLDYRQTCQFLIWPDSARYNKQLKISIRTSTINQALYDIQNGYPLIENIDLPIDLNTNPNQETNSIFNRWNNLPESIFVNKVNINQISDSYYLNLEIDAIYGFAFELGDVILVENANINYAEGESIDLSAQYSVATEITENHEIQVLINSTAGSLIYDNLEASPSNKKEVPYYMLTQPIVITFNSGWKITITAVDRDSSTLNEQYAIQIEKYRKFLVNEV